MAAPVHPPSLETAFQLAADQIHTAESPAQTLQSIVDVARDCMPAIDHVGVTLSHRDGRLETTAATDPLVITLDQIQYELRQGPCVSAIEDGADSLVVSEDVRHEGRWHDFVLRAQPHGLRSMLAVRLFVGATTVGVLNMYSTSSDLIDAETRSMAQLLAAHAAHTYGHRRQVDNLHTALQSREVIGNAVGLVMGRYDLTRERAFEYLVRVAASSETKLRVVAEQLLTDFEAQIAAG